MLNSPTSSPEWIIGSSSQEWILAACSASAIGAARESAEVSPIAIGLPDCSTGVSAGARLTSTWRTAGVLAVDTGAGAYRNQLTRGVEHSVRNAQMRQLIGELLQHFVHEFEKRRARR